MQELKAQSRKAGLLAKVAGLIKSTVSPATKRELICNYCDDYYGDQLCLLVAPDGGFSGR